MAKTKELTLGDLAVGIDNLAVMVQKGFMEMDGKIGKMAKQEDLVALIERLDRFEKYTEKRFDAIDIELRSIRAEIKQLGKGLAFAEKDLRDLDKRVTRLERKSGIKALGA